MKHLALLARCCRVRVTLRAPQLAIEFRHGSGMEAKLEQTVERFSVVSDPNRPQRLRLVPSIQSPVFFQLPGKKPKNAREYECMESSNRAGQYGIHKGCQIHRNVMNEFWQERGHYFGSYCYNREMFNRVCRRFDEEVDVQADDLPNNKPYYSQHQL